MPVAVGVIADEAGRVLVARRAGDRHQGGLWEFPGGKLEAGESVEVALARELQEELGIRVRQSEPLIRIHHDYGDRRVLLEVRKVTAFEGEARGREGQPLRWLAPADMQAADFPAANRPIITALRLPPAYLITGRFADAADFRQRLERALAEGAGLVQFRPRVELTEKEYAALAGTGLEACRQRGAIFLLNGPPELLDRHAADGLHLNSHQLMACEARPVPADKWLCASVHDEQELAQANRIGVDFIVLSPVLPTASHPGAPTLGWERFAALAEQAACPVYALGGMQRSHLEQARARGAQGIASIGAFWGR